MSTSLPDIGTISTAQVDGLKIRYARSGKSSGMPVLLTSPWPESIFAFRGILRAIEDLHPLIAVDLPGFGRSDGRANLMSPQAMGNFVIWRRTVTSRDAEARNPRSRLGRERDSRLDCRAHYDPRRSQSARTASNT